MLIGGYQLVFERCFENINEDQLGNRFSNKWDIAFLNGESLASRPT
jgi:hypothetical protein